MHRTLCTVILSVISLINVVNSVEISDCGSPIGKFTEVLVSGCDYDGPACLLIRETVHTLRITFTPNQNVKTAKMKAYSISGDVAIPFPLKNAEVCLYPETGISCPLEENGSQTYILVMPILKMYPKVSTIAQLQLQDENQENIFCVRVPVKITD